MLSDERIEEIEKGQTCDLFARAAIVELLWEVKRLREEAILLLREPKAQLAHLADMRLTDGVVEDLLKQLAEEEVTDYLRLTVSLALTHLHCAFTQARARLALAEAVCEKAVSYCDAHPCAMRQTHDAMTKAIDEWQQARKADDVCDT